MKSNGGGCTKNLFCFYTNSDTLLNKRAELLHVIENDKPDVICLTEVLPKNFKFHVQLSEINIDGYDCVTNIGDAQASQGGRGVILYIRKVFNAQQVFLSGPNKDVLESVWCEVPLEGKDKLLLGTVYRSPNSTTANNTALNSMLKDMVEGRTHVLITGDFNYPDIDWVEGTSPARVEHKATVFMDTIRDTFLYQHVVKPTHHRGDQQPTLIDLVLSNEEGMVTNLKHNAPLGKSHHQCLTFDFVCYAERSGTEAAGKFAYARGDYEGLKTKVASLDLSSKIKGLNTQDAWNVFSSELEKAMEEFIPKVGGSRPGKKKNPVWFNDKAMAKVKKKRDAYQRYMQTRDGKDYLLYTRSRNQAKTACRKAVKDYEKGVAKAAKGNPKAFYAYAKSKLVTKQGVANLTDSNGKQATTDTDKADVLNKFFCSVFTKEDLQSVPDCDDKNFSTVLDDIEIDNSTVLKLLRTLDISKSAGPDGMHPRVLKELADVVFEPLADVFRKSLSEGIVPTQWKEANVTPLFKKGSKSVPGNYRPVSLTSIPCKLMEKIIRNSVFSHLEENGLLSDCQHGFVSKRSCVTNLVEVLNEWTSSLDDGKPVDAIYLDFSKAFDSVPHVRLMKKMEAYGIRGHVRNWISDFLSNRKQRVKISGSASGWEEVTSGVPQGSVLGPVCFVIFINDLPEVVSSLCHMYADDTKIHAPTDTVEDSLVIQKDLDNLVDWADKWQLRFNADKCQALQLGSKNKKFKYNMRKHGSDEKVTLESSEVERDLGVNVDSDLKFSKHVEIQVNKANRILGLIRRSYEYLDAESLKLLFIALVRPHLEFANCAWSPRLERDKNLIERVLRRATKCIPGFRDLDYETRLRTLKIPSMSYRRIRGDLIETYKYTHGFYDCKNPFELNTQGQTRGHQYKLKKHSCKTNIRQCFFTNRVIDTWNALDKSIVDAPTMNTFKNRLDAALKDYMYSPSVSMPLLPLSPPANRDKV